MPDREKRRKIKDRLESISEAGRRAPSPELDLIKKELLSDVPAINKILLQFSHSSRLKKLINQADMKLKVSTFILISLILFALGVVLSQQLINILPVSILVGGFLSSFPLLVVLYKRKRRLDKFEELFPEALDLLRKVRREEAASGAELRVTDPITLGGIVAPAETAFGHALKA